MGTYEYNKKRPLWKWLLLFIAAFILATLGYRFVAAGYEASQQFLHPVFTIVGAAAVLGLYALFVKLFEGHWPTDLSLRRLVPHTLLGLLVGFIFMVQVVCTIMASAYADVE